MKQHSGFTEKWVVLFLRRTRPIPERILREIFSDKLLRKHYPVRLWLFRNKSIPLAVSVSLMATIRRSDLFSSLKDPWLPNPLKARIETHFLEVFPRLPLGEKIAMARLAPKGLIRHLRTLPQRQVVEALLDNYFFTFEDAMFIANFPKTSPEALRALARSARWNQNLEIKNSLLRHPGTPRDVLNQLVRSLGPFQLKRALAEGRGSNLSKRLIQRELGKRTDASEKKPKKNPTRSPFS